MAESKHVKAFKAEHRRRHGFAPTDDEIRLEETREALHRKRTPATVAAFKEAQHTVARRRSAERGVRETEPIPPEADPRRVDLPDAIVPLGRMDQVPR